jgi:uncharacterized protein (DUF934 family)
MPRQLLRDGSIVDDDWRYWHEEPAPAAVEGASPDAIGLIISHDAWFAERRRWLEAPGRLGIVLGPAVDVGTLQGDLSRLSLIAAEFGSPTEGRGYSQARVLRERLRFAGELRARGEIHQDQVFFLARCGFNALELPAAELAAGRAALATFTFAYQASNDLGLGAPLRLRNLSPHFPG